jgi:hypothetical protein
MSGLANSPFLRISMSPVSTPQLSGLVDGEVILNSPGRWFMHDIVLRGAKDEG